MIANFLFLSGSPQVNYKVFFEIARDFRKGGLTPDNFEEVLNLIDELPQINVRRDSDYKIFEHLNLKDINQEDFSIIIRELLRRGQEKSKKCWHPEACSSSCNVDGSGQIIVSAAHSIQNNGVLSKIAKDGHVTTFSREEVGFKGKDVGKKLASIFWGFCNHHDAMFRPIEIINYTGTSEQNFLYAYRAFVIICHKKIEASHFHNFGSQSENDIIENKNIFDRAILDKDYDAIITHVIELPLFYPIAVSSGFYLDFDFEGNSILHSENRMENIYITVFPDNGKTYCLLSYLKEDENLYQELASQLQSRNNFKSDLTVLLAAHVENIYFEPIYFETFIACQAESILKVFQQAQFDVQTLDSQGNHVGNLSLTPPDYLKNIEEINFFGY
ncbi:hypothetical protein [Sphingobacterium sp. ML3W]|uniref:hypothetical protein n=1 Tax=Sphingobacterium sp. ML3W TaxID=1538644 RepID=UPI00068A9260|nr:hypothetical protein [Sphingobacterium sp. ML3W]